MNLLLDADVIIDILRRRPTALSWINPLPHRPFFSGIAALEVLYGAQNRNELRVVEALPAEFPILWPDESDARTARVYAPLHLAHGIDILYAVTASIAIRHNLSVVSFNIKHFRSIPGLTTV